MLKKLIISLTLIILFSSMPVFAEEVQTSIALEVTSVVEGEKTDEDEIFAFKLIPFHSENPMPSTDEVFITGNDSISFGEMVYNKPNLYKYELSQIKGDSEDYIYDETVYEISVYVTTDNNCVLTPTVIVNRKGSEEKAGSLTFTNTYTKKTEVPEISVQPQTGDSANGMWYMVVTLTSLSVIGYLVSKKKKQK